MIEETSRLHPWRRANLEQPSEVTLELVPLTSQEMYLALIAEIGAAATVLNDLYEAISVAQDRQHTAYEARDTFLKTLGAYD